MGVYDIIPLLHNYNTPVIKRFGVPKGIPLDAAQDRLTPVADVKAW